MIKEFKIFDAVRWYRKGKFEVDAEENQFEEPNDFKVGDYITVIKMPRRPHWLYDTQLRTYKIMGAPTIFGGDMMWSTDGRWHDYDKSGHAGIPEECFRHATPKEIEDSYEIKESLDNDPYDEEDWEDDILKKYYDLINDIGAVRMMTGIQELDDVKYFTFKVANSFFYFTVSNKEGEIIINPGWGVGQLDDNVIRRNLDILDKRYIWLAIMELINGNGIKESLNDLDPYDEEIWENDKPFEVGDYITVINIPKHPHWLYDHKRRRTYKITGPKKRQIVRSSMGKLIYDKEMWNVDGPGNEEIGDWYRLEDGCFRHATPKEIEQTYGI